MSIWKTINSLAEKLNSGSGKPPRADAQGLLGGRGVDRDAVLPLSDPPGVHRRVDPDQLGRPVPVPPRCDNPDEVFNDDHSYHRR